MLWLNGRLLPSETACLNPQDRGFLLGDGVFETLRGTEHLDRHLARLRNGAAVLGIDVGWTDDEIARGAAAVLAGREAVLRITLSRGPGGRGILPAAGAAATLLITSTNLPEILPPARVVIARGTRRNEHSPLSRIKSLNYLDSILARQEAALAGADDAILLNTAGRVAEAAASNLFVSLGGKWVTPPVADGALPGIARALLLEAGFAAERRIEEAWLRDAKAAFLTSSLGSRSIASIDGRAMKESKQGLLF